MGEGDKTHKQVLGRVKFKRAYKKVTAWFASWPLFVSILVGIVLAFVVFGLLAKAWAGWSVFEKLPDDAHDFVIVVFAALVSMSAVGYLVIKYQERTAAKRIEVEAMMNAAITKLGNSDHSTKIAGVYALADIADIYRGSYRQRVVDILCGYLRTERAKDSAVESTITGVIRKHLLKERKSDGQRSPVEQVMADDQLWCDCDFNFHGAKFNEPLIFSYVTFEKTASFVRAVFKEYAYFEEATFEEDAFFAGTAFKDFVFFAGALFEGGVYFTGTGFEHNAGFTEALFEDDADFTGATFEDNADFSRVGFKARVHFKETAFNGSVFFLGAVFEDVVKYTETTFEKGAHFGSVVFKDSADFTNATFTRGKSVSFSVGFPLIDELPDGALWVEPSEEPQGDLESDLKPEPEAGSVREGDYEEK